MREKRQIGLLIEQDAEVADPAAVERIMTGFETRYSLLYRKAREIVACHEMGQALAAFGPVHLR